MLILKINKVVSFNIISVLNFSGRYFFKLKYEKEDSLSCNNTTCGSAAFNCGAVWLRYYKIEDRIFFSGIRPDL